MAIGTAVRALCAATLCAATLGAATLAFGSLAAAQAADDSDKIDLRLFGKQQLDGFDGCSLALWQHNRDPESDRYAYVLFQPFGEDGAPLPAWVKIGENIHELESVASGDTIARGLAAYQVFRDSEATALVDIHDAVEENDGNTIRDARVTVVQSGMLPFRIRVKGRTACPQTSGASSDAVSLGIPREFDSLQGVPAALLDTIQSQLGDICDPHSTPGFGAVYAISDAMSLWQIPCMMAAYQGSSVFLAALNDRPEHNVLLPFPFPPGEGNGDRYDLINPQVDAASGTVTSIARGRGAGDCGVLERHKLVAVEGEAVEFELIEYREKTQCDGVATDPEDYPLVYPLR